MTLQESARSKAIWAATVVVIFVFAGGASGGATVGLAMMAGAIFSSSASLLQLPMGVLTLAFFGVLMGFPAAVVTAAGYIIGVKTLRERWRLAAFGTAASAGWGALFLEMISVTGAPVESLFGMAAFFGFAGFAATLTCFSLLKRWGLQAPS